MSKYCIKVQVFSQAYELKIQILPVRSTLNAGGELIDLSVPKVMGILNLTPDSFYDGSRFNNSKEAISKMASMLDEGAAIIDIGAYSSRPGAAHISEEEEAARLFPVLRALVNEFPTAIISVDTFRSGIAARAVAEGAKMINDISGGEADIEMFPTVAKLKVPYVLMHMKGNPRTMVQQASYHSVVEEVITYFVDKYARLRELGARDVILDPGFGFAKTREHSYRLLQQLGQLRIIDLPILAGVSRKSMISKTLDITADKALNGTTVLNTIALLNGASILRVHDVKEAVEAVKLLQALNPPIINLPPTSDI